MLRKIIANGDELRGGRNIAWSNWAKHDNPFSWASAILGSVNLVPGQRDHVPLLFVPFRVAPILSLQFILAIIDFQEEKIFNRGKIFQLLSWLGSINPGQDSN
jgi:hypothetical protein